MAKEVSWLIKVWIEMEKTILWVDYSGDLVARGKATEFTSKGKAGEFACQAAKVWNIPKDKFKIVKLTQQEYTL